MSGPNFLISKGFKLDAATDQTQKFYPRIYRVVVNGTGTGAAGVGVTVKESSVQYERVVGVVQENTPMPSESQANGLDYALLGRIVNVAVQGITRCVAGAAISVGQRVVSNGDGTVIPCPTAATGGTLAAYAAAIYPIVGIAIGSAATAAGDQIDILLTPGLTADRA